MLSLTSRSSPVTFLKQCALELVRKCTLRLCLIAVCGLSAKVIPRPLVEAACVSLMPFLNPLLSVQLLDLAVMMVSGLRFR